MSQMAKFRIAAVACFLLGSCVTFHAKPLIPEKTAEAFIARTLTDPGLQKFLSLRTSSPTATGGGPIMIDSGLPPAGMTTGPWDLDTLTMTALYYNPDLDIARAQWKAARAGEGTAAERPNPTLSLGPTWVSNPDVGLTPWILGFTLDIPIETAGKRGIRKRQAAAQSEVARQNLAQTAWQIRSRVRSSLLAVLSAQAATAILRHQARELDENALLLSERSKAGRISPLNAAQANVLAGRNRLALEDALRQETEAWALLANVLGIPVKALDGVQLSSAAFVAHPSPEDPKLLEARRAALLGRPDLLASLASYAASEAALQLEIAKQYPDIHLGPGFTYDQGQDKWGIGVTFPLPILNQNKGLIGEGNAHREEAASRFLALQDKIINDIDRSFAGYRAAVRKLNTANEVLRVQYKQDRELRDLLRPGDVSRLTLFRSQLDVDSTELARADALRQAEEALGALEDAQERPLAGATNLPAEMIENNPREPER